MNVIHFNFKIFDAGNYFQIAQIVDEDDDLIGYKALCSNNDGIKCNDPLGYESD
jgi:hypothetical protein